MILSSTKFVPKNPAVELQITISKQTDPTMFYVRLHPREHVVRTGWTCLLLHTQLTEQIQSNRHVTVIIISSTMMKGTELVSPYKKDLFVLILLNQELRKQPYFLLFYSMLLFLCMLFNTESTTISYTIWAFLTSQVYDQHFILILPPSILSLVPQPCPFYVLTH